MANGDISNQLAGVGDSLERFLDALDNASYKLGSNAAMQATQARAAQKMKDQDIRVKKRMDKIEADHAKQIKTMQPVYKKLWSGIKDEVKQRSLLSKGMKDMTKSMTDFAKKAIGGIGKGIMAMGKAGVLGAMVASVKLISDGLFRADAAMAKVAGRVKMTRKELGGVHTAAKGAQASMNLFGVTIEESLATAGNLVEAFGSVQYVTKELIQTATRLELAYGLSAEASSGLVEHLTRANMEARTFVDNIANKATAAGVSASLVMRDMATRTQQMAMHGERGVDAMTQMAIKAAKAGTSMKAFDGAAAAFSDIDTITSGLGDLGARFGEEFVQGIGRPEDLYWAFFEGGKAADDANNKITQSMVDQFEWSKKKGLVDKKGRKVEMGWIKKMAEFRGMEIEDMMRIYKMEERLSKMKPAEIAAEKKEAKIKQSALDRENEILRSQKTIIENLQAIWTGLYSTLSGQLDEIFGVSGTAGSGIKAMGEGLKTALNLEFFAKDVKEGGWAKAIGTRIKAVMKKALQKIFPDFAKELAGGAGGLQGFIDLITEKIKSAIVTSISQGLGVERETAATLAKGAAGIAGVFVAAKTAVTVLEKLGLKRSRENVGLSKKNAMWVQTAGGFGMGGPGGVGAPGVVGGPKPRGAAGQAYDKARGRGGTVFSSAKSALKQSGQGNVAKGAASLFGGVLKGGGKGLLKGLSKVPVLGKVVTAAILAQQAYSAYESGDWASLVPSALSLVGGIAGGIAGSAVLPGVGTIAGGIGGSMAGEAFGNWLIGADIAEPKPTKPSAVEQAAELQARGSIGYRGSAIVGEAGGEVIASRSALRSGIGIGGRAASALAGIGVPGFRTGYADADVSSVVGRRGLQGAAGSQSFRQARASAFQEEQLRQQAAMLDYWRNTYDQKMDALVSETKKEKKEGPSWLQKAFKEYNKEIGFVLDQKLGPNMAAGLMAGMTKWAEGGSLSDAINAGAKAGIVAGLKDKESGLYQLTEKLGAFAGTLRAGLAAFASGGNVGRSMVGAGSHALAGMIGDGSASKMAAQYMGMGMMGGGMPGMPGLPSGRQASHMGIRAAIGMPQGAAAGRYVNRPSLMMVGEGGASEVVIPTERIRKGLPINAGVAKELGSIGVPGFQEGGFWSRLKGGQEAYEEDVGMGGMTSYAGNVGERVGSMGGFSGMGKAAGAGALMSFGNIFQQTGDWKQAATGAAGSGVGVAAGMGLTALGIPPPLSGMIGNMVGGLATKGLNKVFNLTGGYGKGRRRAIKVIEDHIKTGGRFDHGAPGSKLKKAMNLAIGGHEKTPTEANFQKLVEKMGTSPLVASMGVPPPALIALGIGQTSGGAATKMFSSINTSLYGKGGGDKYRKALAVSAVPSLAAGGIVNRPTTALIGEAGPEAVVPLRDSEMVQELKKQNKLMTEMIKTQKETAKTEIRMDGRIVAETVGQNMYDIGTGM